MQLSTTIFQGRVEKTSGRVENIRPSVVESFKSYTLPETGKGRPSSPFGAKGLFSGAFAVSLREANFQQKHISGGKTKKTSGVRCNISVLFFPSGEVSKHFSVNIS